MGDDSWASYLSQPCIFERGFGTIDAKSVGARNVMGFGHKIN